MKNLIAADIPLAPTGGFKGIGPLGLEGMNAAAGGGLITLVLSNVIGVMTIIGFIWFTFTIITGAFRILSSGGDKAALEGARKQITTGVVGIVLVIIAIFIVSLVGTLLGIPNILNIQGFILKFAP